MSPPVYKAEITMLNAKENYVDK